MLTQDMTPDYSVANIVKLSKSGSATSCLYFVVRTDAQYAQLSAIIYIQFNIVE